MPPSFPFLGPVAWAVCLGVASAQADLLDIALTAAAADGVQPVLPLAPRLAQRTEVATEAALVAAVRVPGNDVVLTQDIALTGDLVLEADDVRLRGRHALVGGAIRLSRSLERVALEEFTAPRIAWDGPFAFDDALGDVVFDPVHLVHDVALRELHLTGVPGEITLHIRGRRTLVYRCHVRSPDQFCLFGATGSPLTPSPSNPSPFGLTDLTIVGNVFSNPGSGQANLRVHGCLRQIVAHCTLNTGWNFSLRSHEGSHEVYWGDSQLNGGGFMLTDHAAEPPDAIGSIVLRRLVVNYTNSNGAISVPWTGAGLARIGATHPSHHVITNPRVVLSGVVINEVGGSARSFAEFFGGQPLPEPWTLTGNIRQDPPWGTWLADQFSVDDLSRPEVVGEGADPDGDAHSNLLEYALGLSPSQPNPLPLRVDRVTSDRVEVICPWSVRATDVSITLESAPRVSGAAWHSEGVYVEPEPLTAQTTLLRAHVPFRPGESQRFMRLRVVRY